MGLRKANPLLITGISKINLFPFFGVLNKPADVSAE